MLFSIGMFLEFDQKRKDIFMLVVMVVVVVVLWIQWWVQLAAMVYQDPMFRVVETVMDCV